MLTINRGTGMRGAHWTLDGECLHSKQVCHRRGRVRRAKLYYLRNLTGKATRIREKKVRVAVPETGTAAE